MFFEYKRGLPHAWYTHQTFWILSAISQFILLVSTTYGFSQCDFETDTIGQDMFVKLCCCYSIGILLCGALSYLSIKYKREAPQHLRTYFPVGTKAPTDPTNDPFLHKDSKLPRSSTAVLHTLPIIKATITNYTIDQGIVFFKLIVSKDSYPQKKLKKTFGDFEELDQIIESKYVKYLR